MNKLIKMLLLSMGIVLLTGMLQSSSADMLSGQVLMNGQRASAVVIAVPYDAQTHQISQRQAIVVPTDATGNFHMNTPGDNYLLVAWDGHNGSILDSPATTAKMDLTEQGPPVYQLAADCGWKCECHHLVGNLYLIWQWGNSKLCGQYQYISWGCKC